MGKEIELLFREVADLAPDARERHFAERQISAEIRAEIESLLAFDTARLTAPDCIGSTARQYTGGAAGPSVGGRCGAYELVRMLGEGGMGAVFLGRRTDGEVEQQVAIKFVRSAGSSAFRERFLRERQILASLNHPGIARLLDAGHTEDGQPYLVMEYIEGVPLDDYCRKLEFRDQLKLCLRVCDAIAYAHRNLVVHRDLKPSNILVDATGEPKLLDFGIARILDETADAAMTQERILTPDYASPEQIRGTAHSTATDVYSLGAVIYRVLTNRAPHEPSTGSAEPIEARICSGDITPPRKLNKALPKDLDFILGKAMRKDSEERYASVDALAEDIRALLDSRPIRARSGSTLYRARKFMRRHWLPVATAAGVILTLSIGLLVVNEERSIAQHRFQQLRQLANRLLDFDKELAPLPGSTRARQKIVSDSMEYLEGLSREAGNDKDLAMEIALGYETIAGVQGVPNGPSLGQYANARESLEKARPFVERVLAADSRRPDARVLAGYLEMDLMMIADTEHRDVDTLRHARAVEGHFEALVGNQRASQKNMQQASDMCGNLAVAFMNLHLYEEGIRSFRRVVELERSSLGARPYEITLALSGLANAQRQSGDLEGALRSITEARSIADHAQFPDDNRYRNDVFYTVPWRQGVILGYEDSIGLNRPGEAVVALQLALDVVEAQSAKDVNDIRARLRVGTASRELGAVLAERDPTRAVAVYDHGLVRLREAKNNVRARRQEAQILAQSAYPLRRLHREREAQARIEAALDLLREAKLYPASKISLGDEPETVIRAQAEHTAATGSPARALDMYRDLLDKIMASKPDPQNDLSHAHSLSRIYLASARLLLNTGSRAEAERFDTQRLELWRAWNAKLPNNPYVQRQLAVTLE
jgi:serine/threonine protein kinase/tetratricopeptide (TPR) repeat protein